MQIKDFFWQYFQETGMIGAYLLYKNLVEEEEFLPSLAVPKEE